MTVIEVKPKMKEEEFRAMKSKNKSYMRIIIIMIIMLAFICGLLYSSNKKRNYWGRYPKIFVSEVRSKLNERDFKKMTEMLAKYNAFEQNFFGDVDSMKEDPVFRTEMFAGFLGDMAIQLSKNNEDITDIEKLLRYSVIINPKQYGSHAALSFLLFNEKKYFDACEHATIAYEGFIKMQQEMKIKKIPPLKGYEDFPDDEMMNSLKKVMFYLDEGLIKDTQAFSRSAEKKIYIDDMKAFSLITEGNSFGMEGRYDEAIKVFQEVIEKSTNNVIRASAYSSLGNTYGRLSQFQKSIAALSESVKLDPTAASAWGDLGASYLNMDKYNLAIECINKAKAQSWQDDVKEKCLINLTYIYLKKRDRLNTKNNYELLVKQNPLLAAELVKMIKEENAKLFMVFQKYIK